MKPILFNTDMVRALLAGRKTVTRRVVRPHYRNGEAGFRIVTNKHTGQYVRIEIFDEWEDETRWLNEPYRPGDILYVREAWYKLLGHYIYRADQKPGMKNPGKWHPSIHMPREAARIFLRVTDVRVERLQNMLPCDIQREGCPYIYSGFDEEQAPDWYGWMKNVWDSTIKPADRALYGWDANPYVWVIEFERISREEALVWANSTTPGGGT